MMKRIYDLSRQKKPYWCLPASIQAILRRYARDEFQHRIAREIGCTGEECLFGKNLADFFKKRNLIFDYYCYNALPLENDPYFIFSEAFEKDYDLIVGSPIQQGARLHIELATDFHDPFTWLLNPPTCFNHQENVHDLCKKMHEQKAGAIGLVRRL